MYMKVRKRLAASVINRGYRREESWPGALPNVEGDECLKARSKAYGLETLSAYH